jgi:A/G-specific adenine glycosylase
MELGATVCTPKNPACDACPVRRFCAARKHGDVDRYPLPPKRAKIESRRYLFAAVTDEKGRVLLVRRPEGDRESLLPGGMWELPHVEWSGSRKAAIGALAETLGCPITTTGKLKTRSHAIMNFRLTLAVQTCRANETPKSRAGQRWFTRAQAQIAAIASATRKLLEAIS